MNGRMYSAPFAASVTNAQDFWEINVPSTAVVILHEISLGQITDVGDTNEEILDIIFKRNNTTSGSGGSTVTPTQMFASAAFGGTVEINNTTKATGGTALTLRRETWNIRTQFLWLPVPEDRIVLPPSARFNVELVTAPGSTISIRGNCVFEAVS